MVETVTRGGAVYGWCSECQGWWRVIKDRLRTHRVWDGVVAPRCEGSLTDPASHHWIKPDPPMRIYGA